MFEFIELQKIRIMVVISAHVHYKISDNICWARVLPSVRPSGLTKIQISHNHIQFSPLIFYSINVHLICFLPRISSKPPPCCENVRTVNPTCLARKTTQVKWRERFLSLPIPKWSPGPSTSYWEESTAESDPDGYQLGGPTKQGRMKWKSDARTWGQILIRSIFFFLLPRDKTSIILTKAFEKSEWDVLGSEKKCRRYQKWKLHFINVLLVVVFPSGWLDGWWQDQHLFRLFENAQWSL